jgi:DNA-binding response OmpR family regulator
MASATPSKKRILLLDDSALQLQLVRDALEQRGYEVATAPDIVEFERLLQDFKPEIVLTDLVMPDVSGHVVVQTLKESMSKHKIPVILFSSQPEAELAIIAEAVGADGHVSKEGGVDKLGERIDRLVAEIFW